MGVLHATAAVCSKQPEAVLWSACSSSCYPSLTTMPRQPCMLCRQQQRLLQPDHSAASTKHAVSAESSSDCSGAQHTAVSATHAACRGAKTHNSRHGLWCHACWVGLQESQHVQWRTGVSQVPHLLLPPCCLLPPVVLCCCCWGPASGPGSQACQVRVMPVAGGQGGAEEGRRGRRTQMHETQACKCNFTCMP